MRSITTGASADTHRRAPLEAIDAELREAEEKIARLLREVLG